MYRAIPSPMRFMVLSSLVVLTTMSLLIHGVQGIRHIRRASLAPLEHQPAHQDVTQAFVSGPPASTGGTNFEDTEAEMMVVVRGIRRRSLSSRPAASGKNKFHQKQHHHWMPSIHEDYFGPRHHKAAHH
uniref:Uncharacterized protein n=1 Tax=Kalanchoe fedtschenkoi TaxID=63787 RepID=A0A7N0RH71_KALFE